MDCKKEGALSIPAMSNVNSARRGAAAAGYTVGGNAVQLAFAAGAASAARTTSHTPARREQSFCLFPKCPR